jgi:predicted ribosome quality control (RQC) complex YloA/Tae2 family protein
MKGVTVLYAALNLLLMVGCSTDRESLDRFSRTYTSFYDRASFTKEYLQLAVHPESDYWRALEDMTNIRASNESRARSAARAIETYRREISPFLLASSSSFGMMDSSVTALIEAANHIENQDARAKAVLITRHAREMHTALGWLLPLTRRRFEAQLALSQEFVSAGGAMSAIDAFLPQSEEATKMRNDSDQRWRELADHWQKAKDAFSSLKSRFNLKSYSSRWDSISTATEARE